MGDTQPGRCRDTSTYSTQRGCAVQWPPYHPTPHGDITLFHGTIPLQQGCGGHPQAPRITAPAACVCSSFPSQPPFVLTEPSPGCPCPFPTPGGTRGHIGELRDGGCALMGGSMQAEGLNGRRGSTSTTPGGTATTRAWMPFASTTAGASARDRWPSRRAPPSGSCPRTWARWCISAPRRAFGASTRSSRMARPAPTTTSASSARWVSADPGPDGTSGGGLRAHRPWTAPSRGRSAAGVGPGAVGSHEPPSLSHPFCPPQSTSSGLTGPPGAPARGAPAGAAGHRAGGAAALTRRR